MSIICGRGAVLVLLFAVASGCGGGGDAYRIPTDSKLKPFAAPERDELVEESDDDWDEDEPDEPEESGEGTGTGTGTGTDKGKDGME